MAHRDFTRGAYYALGAALLMASMAAGVRLCAAELTNAQLVFLRNAFGLTALLPWLLARDCNFLLTRHIGFHLTRSLSGLAAMYCFFYAIAHLALADAMLLNFSSPLFVAPLARVFLQEPLPLRIVSAMGVGFIGVTLVLKPDGAFFSGAGSIGLLSGLLSAVAMISVRRLAATEPTLRTVFYFSLISTVLSALPALWQWETPSIRVLFIMAVTGMLATSGQMLLTKAYSLAPAARIGPYTYTSVVFAGLIDWMFWRQIPDSVSILGAAMVCLSGHLVQTTPAVMHLPALGPGDRRK